MNAPIPNTPARLHGSFNLGYSASPEAIMNDFLRRVELTSDPAERLMQAQRTIGALMGLTAFGAKGTHVSLHRDIFHRLAELTGVTPNELVASAGVAR